MISGIEEYHQEIIFLTINNIYISRWLISGFERKSRRHGLKEQKSIIIHLHKYNDFLNSYNFNNEKYMSCGCTAMHVNKRSGL